VRCIYVFIVRSHNASDPVRHLVTGRHFVVQRAGAVPAPAPPGALRHRRTDLQLSEGAAGILLGARKREVRI
jgi:hypothetical protein